MAVERPQRADRKYGRRLSSEVGAGRSSPDCRFVIEQNFTLPPVRMNPKYRISKR